jgi:hypothetical protein
MLFSWLYPGGNGDFNESRKVDIGVKDWARQQLFMADSRSAKDKTWCVYALNYAERRRNMTQGQWFLKNLLHTKEIPCIVKLLPLPQPLLRSRTDARTNPSAQRATQLRSVLAHVYAVSRQNQITTTVP